MTAATPHHFFRSATDLLATGGVSALTLASVCKRTEVTSGSFYHHFGSWDRFVGRFLDDWESHWTQRIIQISNQPADARSRFDALIRLAGTVPHAAESSIRAWANSNPAVAAAQERVDAQRLDHIRSLLSQIVDDARDVERLATFVLSAFVGAELLHGGMTPASIGSVFEDIRTYVLAVASGVVVLGGTGSNGAT